jgi:hypothetical protein
MMSSTRPFTELLPDAINRLMKVVGLLMPMKTRPIQTIGIVTTTIVDEEEAPPGISKFIKYMARPWNSQLDHFALQVTSHLSDTPTWTDRCLHQLTRPDEPDSLTTLNFDWQRVFKTPTAVTETSLRDLVNACQDHALQYFEELAQGDNFDV